MLLEMALFRMFARTGIYLFNEDSPGWIYQAYASAVWLGNTMFNFATMLSLLLLALAAGYLWMRRRVLGNTLPMLIGVMAVWNIALTAVSSGTWPMLLYLAVSLAIAVVALVSVWPRTATMERIALALLAASFAGVYYFETIAPLRNAGIVFADRGIAAFQVSEALAGLAIISAFVAWGRTRSLKLLALPAFAGLVMAGSYFSAPDRFPLITTWSLGVTMAMPFMFYVIGLVLLGVTLLKLVTTGRPTLAYGFTLVFFSHRMLPLTYFNVLILVGFALIAVAIADRSRKKIGDAHEAANHEQVAAF